MNGSLPQCQCIKAQPVVPHCSAAEQTCSLRRLGSQQSAARCVATSTVPSVRTQAAARCVATSTVPSVRTQARDAVRAPSKATYRRQARRLPLMDRRACELRRCRSHLPSVARWSTR